MEKEKYKFPCEIDLETYKFIKMFSETSNISINEIINDACNSFVDTIKEALTINQN